MTIPIYDQSILPCVNLPMSNLQEVSERYLGYRALSGEMYADITITAKSHSEAKAVNDFWKNDCTYGLEPFIIHLPFFGDETDVNLLVMFQKDIRDSRSEIVWALTRSLNILGKVVYTVDGNGDFILTTEGDFVLSDTGDYIALPSDTYKELTYYGVN